MGQEFASSLAGRTINGIVRGVVSQSVRMVVTRQGKMDFASIAADAFGNAIGESVADSMRGHNWGADDTEMARLKARYPVPADDGGSSASTYTGGQAWAADVAARRADTGARQIDELLASVGSGGVSVDTRPGSVYVQPGDTLSRIAARFPEYGSANDLKNQLIAANPQLSDPNLLTEGMELRFPGTGTVVDGAAMARAVGSDERYRAALVAQQPTEPLWSFREASMARLKLENERAIAELVARLENQPRHYIGPVTGPSPADLAKQRELTLRNMGAALAGPPVAVATFIPVASASLAGTGALYSTVGWKGTAALGFVTGGGMDAGMQYVTMDEPRWREVRIEQSMVAGLIGAVSGPVGATSGLRTNIMLGGTGAVINTQFQNSYYGDDKSLTVSSQP
jgi:LysM domain